MLPIGGSFWESLPSADTDPAAQAIAGGFAADRVGWAFASGYQAALRALVTDLPHDTLTAFCVSGDRLEMAVHCLS